VDFLIFMLAALAVIVVLVAISNARNRPAPESEAQRDRRLRLEKAGASYRMGNRAMWRGARDQAITHWNEAYELGDMRGLTGLGVAEFKRGDRAGAKSYWRRAAALGEPSAQILLALGKNSPVSMTRSEFIDLLLRAEPEYPGSDINLSGSELEVLMGVAAILGHEDYARLWIPVLERKRDTFRY